MSDMYFTADNHFWHGMILKLSDRPFETIEEMNEVMVERWNSTVGPKDHVYHLGDFSFGNRPQIESVLDRLNGQKHLILGNHDRKSGWFVDRFVAHRNYQEMRVGGQMLVLMHYPIERWNARDHGSWHLHGHCHGNLPSTDKRLDVGVDCWDYAPVSFEQIAEVMATRPERGT